MSKRILPSLLTILFALAFCLPVLGRPSSGNLRGTYRLSLPLCFLNGASEREQDGLNGPVRRVRTETAKLSNKNGKLVEGPRVPLEVAAYDIKGAKIENAYYPVPGGAVTGKEVYKYDDKGNIIEMTLQDEKGTLLSKETYTYEFDQFGNWTKMTTSVAVIENGKITFEPTEVTYRSISYYLDEATLAKMNQATPANTNAAASTPNASASNTTPSNNNNASTSNTQPSASAPSKPVVTKPIAPANDSAAASKQPSQTVANNTTAANSSDSSKQLAQPTAAPSSSVSVVKTSAPVSDKPSAPSGEQSKSASDKQAEAKAADAEASNKPIAKPLLRPVSAGVLNGKALNLPKPTYPLTAKSARLTGVVIVEVVVDINGKVVSARAVSGPVLLQQAAVQAAYQARFSPTILSGQPVKVAGTINYNFALSQ